jgi:hypothetical protein
MSPAFSARSVTLREILSGTSLLVTPGFQRPYSWTRHEVAPLLESLLHAIDELERRPERGGLHFLGTVVLIQAGTRPDDTKGQVFEIVDGQQRLVTIAILFAILRDCAKRDGDDALAAVLDARIKAEGRITEGGRAYRVSVRDSDNLFLQSNVQRPDACWTKVDTGDLSQPQENIIDNRDYLLSELERLDPETRSRLAGFLQDNCHFVVITTDDIDNAFGIFEIVNKVGKPLGRHDILKAELIADVAPAERAAYVQRWEQMERAVKGDFEQMFSHLRAAYGNARAPIIAEIRNLVRQYRGGRRFLDEVVFPTSDVFAAMMGQKAPGAALPERCRHLLSYLDWLGHSDWVPSALLWLSRKRQDDAARIAFLEALDRYAYGQMFLGIGRGKRLTRYIQIQDAINAGDLVFSARGPLELSAEDQKNIIYNTTNSLYDRNSAACKLLLLRLNDQIAGRPTGLDPSEVTIEHILPQKVGNNSQWRQWFPGAAREYWMGSLGNLLLVGAKTNKEARNSEFEVKRQHYLKDDKFARQPLNSSVMGLTQWGPAEVEARERRLIEELRKLWRLSGPIDRKPPPTR